MSKIVYIAHPVSGDMYNTNIQNIKKIYRDLAIEGEVTPFVPYLASLSCLDDWFPPERVVGIRINKVFFERKTFDELWIYGKSKGVNEEILWANEFGIPVIYK